MHSNDEKNNFRWSYTLILSDADNNRRITIDSMYLWMVVNFVAYVGKHIFVIFFSFYIKSRLSFNIRIQNMSVTIICTDSNDYCYDSQQIGLNVCRTMISFILAMLHEKQRRCLYRLQILSFSHAVFMEKVEKNWVFRTQEKINDLIQNKKFLDREFYVTFG